MAEGSDKNRDRAKNLLAMTTSPVEEEARTAAFLLARMLREHGPGLLADPAPVVKASNQDLLKDASCLLKEVSWLRVENQLLSQQNASLVESLLTLRRGRKGRDAKVLRLIMELHRLKSTKDDNTCLKCRGRIMAGTWALYIKDVGATHMTKECAEYWLETFGLR